MKKLFIITTVISSLLSAAAIAKTEGNYLGVDLIYTNTEYTNPLGTDVREQENFSLGANYKYAFNFNNFFVAPGVFYNNNDVRAGRNAAGLYQHLRYSYGAKVDLGYDINDKFAALVTVGHSENRLDVYGAAVTQESFVYGIGAKYSVRSDVDLNLGYELSQFGKSTEIFHEGGDDNFNPDYRVAKVGVSFKF